MMGRRRGLVVLALVAAAAAVAAPEQPRLSIWEGGVPESLTKIPPSDNAGDQNTAPPSSNTQPASPASDSTSPASQTTSPASAETGPEPASSDTAPPASTASASAEGKDASSKEKKKEAQHQPKRPTEPHTLILVTCNSTSLDEGLMTLLAKLPAKAMWEVKVFEKCGERYTNLFTSNDVKQLKSFRIFADDKKGREFGTYLDYVTRHYGSLRGNYIFMPGNLKHGRLDHLERMANYYSDLVQGTYRDPEPQEAWRIENGMASFACVVSTNLLKDWRDFAIKEYTDHKLTPADPPIMGAWTSKHLGAWEEEMENTHNCWQGTFRTTAANIFLRPRQLYSDLASQIKVSPTPQAGHFTERLARYIFGDKVLKPVPHH